MNTTTKKALTGLFIFIGLLIIGHGLLVLKTGSDVKEAHAALVALDRPMKAEDIIPPKIPDAQNAALHYEKAFLLIEAAMTDDGTEGEENAHPLRAKISDMDKTKLERAQSALGASELVQAMALIREGTAKPSCRFDIDYHAGPSMQLASLSNTRQAQKLILLNALHHLHQGNAEAGYADFETALKFCDATRSEPILISGLVRIAQISMTLEALESALKIAPPNELQGRMLHAELTDIFTEEDMYRSIDGERLLFGEWIFNAISGDKNATAALSASDMEGFPVHLYNSYLLRPISQADRAAYLNYMASYTEQISKPYEPGPLPCEEAISKWTLFTSMLAPALGSVLGKQTELTAKIHLARTAIGIRMHEQKHASRPNSVAEIDPAIFADTLMDPFVTQPLRWSGDTLYSVGKNQQDDNGDAKADIPWAL